MEVNERQVVSGDGGDVPSFDDLLFDDTLDDLERIGRYATSAIALQRLVHVRLVGETARAVGCVAASDGRTRARARARAHARAHARASPLSNAHALARARPELHGVRLLRAIVVVRRNAAATHRAPDLPLLRSLARLFSLLPTAQLRALAGGDFPIARAAVARRGAAAAPAPRRAA